MFRPARTLLPRIVALLGVAAYLMAWFGVIPTGSWVMKSLGVVGERYPCEGGVCGCASPQQCWTECQCQTIAQKIAWAKRTGQPIPSYVTLPDTAAYSNESAPSCELCAHTEQTAIANEPEEQSRSCPRIGPLGCRGLTPFLVVSVITLTSPTSTCQMQRGLARRALLIEASTPESRTLDTSAPPPRS